MFRQRHADPCNNASDARRSFGRGERTAHWQLRADQQKAPLE